VRGPRLPRPSMRRVVVVVPSLFTLFNLFFGIWSMVLATRGEYYRASWYVVFAAILDTMDGRVARLSNTGSRFGAELDSLVDLGSAGQAEWIFCYFYVMAVAIRLARFNVTQAGTAKGSFIGLPSPAAGVTLATYYPFTQTAIYVERLRGLPWHLLLQLLMILLTILMVSQVRYAALPRVGMRSGRRVLGLITVLLIVGFAIWRHDVFLFPLGVAYMGYGVLRAAFVGLLSEPDDDEDAEIAGPIVISDGGGGATPFDEDDTQDYSQGGVGA